MFEGSEDKGAQPKKDDISLKKKREQFTVEIRKQKRDDEISKFRSFGDQSKKLPSIHDSIRQPTEAGSEMDRLHKHIDECLKREYKDSEFYDLMKCVMSEDLFQQHFGTIGLRKLLAREGSSPIQEIIDSNIVIRLMQFMLREEQPHLLLESAWVLTNIASGTSQQTQCLVDKGAIPLFIQILGHKHSVIAEQAVWALGNIAGDNTNSRDMVILYGGVHKIVQLFARAKTKKAIKHIIWSLANLVRGRPLPEFDQVKPAIPVFARVLTMEDSVEVLSEALWALVYLTDGEDDDKLQVVLDTGLTPSLIKLLRHQSSDVIVPTLRLIGNIVAGTSEQTQEIIGAGALLEFELLLTAKKSVILREVCWSLSNITAGTEEQVHQVIERELIVKQLLQMSLTAEGDDLRREAIWVLSNATNHGKPEDIYSLVNAGLLEAFQVLLDSPDTKTVSVVLESLYYILLCGRNNFREPQGENIFLSAIERMQISTKIESLQTHPEEDVYLKALLILDTFYESEELI